MKTENFLLIHNFNTVPEELVAFAKEDNYLIYDCSGENSDAKKRMDELGMRVKEVPNTGHNITSYFSFFAENYDRLPEVMCLLKGNIIGRHVSKEFLEKVIDNKSFTFLYDEKQHWGRFSRYKDTGEKNELEQYATCLAMENVYLEYNSGWYNQPENHPNRYFDDIDDLMRFIYKNPMIPQYFAFAPGACYIVRREQVRKYSREFYLNLNKLMDYGVAPDFPAEAYQIERMLPIIFNTACEVNDYMNDPKAFEEKLPECTAYIQYKWENRPRKFKKLRQFLHLI